MKPCFPVGWTPVSTRGRAHAHRTVKDTTTKPGKGVGWVLEPTREVRKPYDHPVRGTLRSSYGPCSIQYCRNARRTLSRSSASFHGFV